MGEHDIVEFPNPRPDEEQLSRIKAEAERLANQPEVERAYRLPKQAEALGIAPATLRAMVHAILKGRAERVAAGHLQQEREQQRQERQRLAEDRKQAQLAKTQARERQQAEKEAKKQAEKKKQQAEKDKQRAEKEAELKHKEKMKALAGILRLPVAQHDGELAKLAKRLDEDIAALRQELKEFAGVAEGMAAKETEPWPEPVDLAELLTELSGKISRYVVMVQPHQMTATVLWTAHCWLYDHRVPIHSPMLAATSAEANSGKSTLVVVVGHATPRFKLNIETTGPTLYRYVDQFKPTMALDEADDIFKRRSDLKHIINAGWTRNAKIPRQERIGGMWRTVWFDPFTPKVISLLGSNLPQAIRTRCIELRMVPKRPDEKVEEFTSDDDAEFAVLRRKFARWAADKVAALKDAKPILPHGLVNRAAANWKLLLAIAELAGGSWPERAREAAERLSQSGRSKLSNGRQLLAAIKTMFVTSGKKALTSESIVTELIKDPTDIWVAFNRGGPITQRQIAWLLDAYDIHPQPIHPTSRGDYTKRGYTAEQFADAFARYLPNDPNIRTFDRQPAKKRRPPKRKRRLKSRSKRR